MRILFGVAEMEQETRRERQKAGIAVAKKNGVYKGRKPGSTQIKPSRARELWQKGHEMREIANALGVSEASISRYLSARRGAK